MMRFIFALLLLTAAFPGTSLAQEAATGMSLTPHTIDEAGDPGQVISSVVEVRNISDTPQTYYLFTRDIEGVAENGRPLYVDASVESTPLNLSQWIALSRSSVEVAPAERVSVPFVITIPEDAPPGGHFASIFGSLEPPKTNVEGVGAGVGYRVGNLINVRVSGDIDEAANVRSLQTDRFIYGTKDVQFIARVENTGNVLVRPTGPLKIVNMLGDTVATVTLNESRAGVFPGTTRELNGAWDDTGLGFGRYTAEAALVYGIAGEAQYTITGNTTFWVLPWEIIRPLLITLVILALVSYVMVRRYINQQVRKLAGGRRLVRTTAAHGPSPLLLASIVMLFLTAFTIFLLLIIFA